MVSIVLGSVSHASSQGAGVAVPTPPTTPAPASSPPPCGVMCGDDNDEPCVLPLGHNSTHEPARKTVDDDCRYDATAFRPQDPVDLMRTADLALIAALDADRRTNLEMGPREEASE